MLDACVDGASIVLQNNHSFPVTISRSPADPGSGANLQGVGALQPISLSHNTYDMVTRTAFTTSGDKDDLLLPGDTVRYPIGPSAVEVDVLQVAPSIEATYAAAQFLANLSNSVNVGDAVRAWAGALLEGRSEYDTCLAQSHRSVAGCLGSATAVIARQAATLLFNLASSPLARKIPYATAANAVVSFLGFLQTLTAQAFAFSDSTAYLKQGQLLQITTQVLRDGTGGTPYDQTLQATGGTTPYTWAITSGSPPDGLSLDPTTGVISGTPTTAALSEFEVTVTDTDGATAIQDYTLTVTATAAPGPPTSLAAAAGDKQVTLTWKAPTSMGASPITGYDVYEGTSPGAESATPVANGVSSGYAVASLNNGTTYYFMVEAVNASGNSAASNEASATPRAASCVSACVVSGTVSANFQWQQRAQSTDGSITVVETYDETVTYYIENAPVSYAGGVYSSDLTSGSVSASYQLNDSQTFTENGSSCYEMITANGSLVPSYTPGAFAIRWGSIGTAIGAPSLYLQDEWAGSGFCNGGYSWFPEPYTGPNHTNAGGFGCQTTAANLVGGCSYVPSLGQSEVVSWNLVLS